MGFSVAVDVINDKKIQDMLSKMPKKAEKLLWPEIQRATIDVHKLAVKNIQERSPGERQTRYKPRRNVIASKAGSPPNTDRGRLASSVEFEFQRAKLSGRVGTSLKYGLWLEVGTQDMDARPWLRPAFRKALVGFRKRVRELGFGK